MSLRLTKEQLVQLLRDPDNKVISLTGKWGTGKSYMWNEVRVSSMDSNVKNALYVSLFGLSSMEQLKLKIIQNALPDAKNHPKAWESAGVIIRGAKKVLTSIHQGFSALDELALLAVPSILKEKVIVLDDIERKHDKLNIDEVLGFIDEFTQQHDTRFLLILNSDQLSNREVWNTLREKVVDQELRLNTSAAEAFEIAIKLSPSPHAIRIRATVENCRLTNIRIIRKIIKAVNQILGDRQGLSNAVLSRIIPSTVLLAAIHYKGIEDGPDFDFVLAQGATRHLDIFATENDVDTDDGKRRSRWRLFMNELGIRGCDGFELLVVEFLQSGLFDISKVAQIIDRYVAEDDAMNALNECQTFFERSWWDHRMTETELLAEAIRLTGQAHLLDAHTATALYETIAELPGGQAAADSLVDKWLEAFRTKKHEEISVDNPFHHKLHPRFESEFISINAKAQANLTARDACFYIANNSGWGPRQEIAMKSATVQDMEAIIRTSPIPDLKLFMANMLSYCIDKQTYERHFGSAMDNFVHACRTIVQDPNSGRLCKLVKTLFADSKLTKLLEISEPQVVHVDSPRSVSTPS